MVSFYLCEHWKKRSAVTRSYARIRAAGTTWLKVYEDIPNGYFDADPRKGGVSIPQTECRTHLLESKRKTKFCEDGGEWSRTLIEYNALSNMWKKCETPYVKDNRTITGNEDLAVLI